MPLPSLGLVGAGSSAGSRQDATSAVGTTWASGESHTSWHAATEAKMWCGTGKKHEMLKEAGMIGEAVLRCGAGRMSEKLEEAGMVGF